VANREQRRLVEDPINEDDRKRKELQDKVDNELRERLGKEKRF
jgi:hypothetical protein